jgi:RNA polymerase sigma-70 factor (ECF subfamily)
LSFHRKMPVTHMPAAPERAGVESRDLGPLADLVPRVLDQLREMARRQLAREHAQRTTLQTTELVHETYLRLVGVAGVTQRGRAYFCAAAARAMRQVLIDAARRRNSAKRGWGVVPQTLDEDSDTMLAAVPEPRAVRQALRDLESRHPRCARTVQCRFFCGMSVDETAAELGVSARTVKSDWACARAWLHGALRDISA